MLRFQHGAGGQNDAAGRNVLARETAIGAELQPFRHRYAVAFDSHVLLHENSVCALWHCRTGEDANGFARPERQTFLRAGRETAGNQKRCIPVRPQIRMPHRIAIDGGIVERRQIDRGFYIVSYDATARTMQRHAFDFRNRCDPLADEPLHIVEPQQRTGKGEAVVGELRHYAPLAAALIAATGAAFLSNRSAIASTLLRSITGIFACGSAISAAIATICGSSG